MSDQIHIVCLDAPSPPDYGGAIDMYYKITSLAAIGKKIVLHYFDYKNRSVESLKKYCTEIHSYKRKNFARSFSFFAPYIITSRINQILINRLNQDDHPIILEGIHCIGILPHLKNKNRAIVRMHNDEAEYYKGLAKEERNFLKRSYFLLEGRLLKKYYKKLEHNTKFACLSQADIETLKTKYKFQNIYFIPCFVSWQTITAKEGKGKYCLYHGNMSVSENEAAAMWLVQNVFSKINIPFIIAGKAISKKLSSWGKQNKNIIIINDPSIEKINELIQNAQINILPSLNSTGVKLKLLHALFAGRFCITNDNGIKGIGIESGSYRTNETDEYLLLIKNLFEEKFSEKEIQERQSVLLMYNNIRNAERLNELL